MSKDTSEFLVSNRARLRRAVSSLRAFGATLSSCVHSLRAVSIVPRHQGIRVCYTQVLPRPKRAVEPRTPNHDIALRSSMGNSNHRDTSSSIILWNVLPKRRLRTIYYNFRNARCTSRSFCQSRPGSCDRSARNPLAHSVRKRHCPVYTPREQR